MNPQIALLPQWVLIVAACLRPMAGGNRRARWAVVGAIAIAGLSLLSLAPPEFVAEAPLCGQDDGGSGTSSSILRDGVCGAMEWLVLAIAAILIAIDDRTGARMARQHALLLLLSAATTTAIVAVDLIVVNSAMLLATAAGTMAWRECHESTPDGVCERRLTRHAVIGLSLLMMGCALTYAGTGSTRLDLINAAFASQRSIHHIPNSNPLTNAASYMVIGGVAWQWLWIPCHTTVHGRADAVPLPGLVAVLTIWRLAGLPVMLRLIPGMSAADQFTSAILFPPAGAGLLWSGAAMLRRKHLAALFCELVRGTSAFAMMAIAIAVNRRENATGSYHVEAAVVILVAAESIALAGVAAVLKSLSGQGHSVAWMDDLSGLAKSSIPKAVCLSILAAVAMALPPLAGFQARIWIVLPALRGAEASWLGTLAGIAAIAAMLGSSVAGWRLLRAIWPGVSIRRYSGWGTPVPTALAFFITAAAITISAVPGTVMRTVHQHINELTNSDAEQLRLSPGKEKSDGDTSRTGGPLPHHPRNASGI